MTIYILAAGKGNRCRPYSDTRPKCLIPVANKPVIVRLCENLLESTNVDIIVAAHAQCGSIRSHFLGQPRVTVVEVPENAGTAETLLSVWQSDERALVFYGDVLIHTKDIESFVQGSDVDDADPVVRLLSAPVEAEEASDWICAEIHSGEGSRLNAMIGHPREKASPGRYHRPVGFDLPKSFRVRLEACPEYFPNSEVGMMVPPERHIESAIELSRRDGHRIEPVVTVYPSVDIDKPWHILDANMLMIRWLCEEMETDGDRAATDDVRGTSIDPSASIDGCVRLGAGSRIGKNVIIRGNLIAGENVTIDAGAIIDGDVVIGDESFVGNGCFIEGGSCIGKRCVVSHAAELSGVIFDNVYLYHYMEICGVIGENTDIGAATVCGTLRFDDGGSTIRINGRKERPKRHSNATYIGDYCRTGVNATIMPGHRIGPYSIVGAGVVLENDLPPRTGVRVKQNLEHFEWGPERYGW